MSPLEAVLGTSSQLREQLVNPVKAGRHQQKPAQPAHEHGEPEPEGPHRGRSSQQGDSVQRWDTDDGGEKDDRQPPAFLSNQVKQLGHERAKSGTGWPDRALLADLPPMLDEGELPSLTHAKEEHELSRRLADSDADGDGNGPHDGRHLRGDDICLGVDDWDYRRHGPKTDRGEQGDQLSPPERIHGPNVPEAGRAYFTSAAR